MKLRPYQETAADFLYERDRALVLAPVGAGKTAVALTAMQDMLRDGLVRRWLVLAPLRVAEHVWPVEAPKWAPGLTVAVARGGVAGRRAALRSGAPVVAINYESAHLLDMSLFDGVVFDELTRLKNPSGIRYKTLEKAIANINVRWGLTGSFTSNGLEDVFGQCKIVDQDLLGRTKGAFMQRFFVLINRDWGEWQPRRGALEQVMDAVRPATFLLEPGEYKDQLPPLHIVQVICEMADRKPYEKMKRDCLLELEGAVVSAPTAAAVTNKLQQLAAGFLYDTRSEASDRPGKWDTTRKAIWLSAHKYDALENLLAENQRDNTLLVYNFVEELAELRRRYPKLRTIDDPGTIDDWNAGRVPLLAVHPKSAGHGLNLQHGGNKIVFMSLPWSLELFEQTVGRLHRGGQSKEVWCYILTCSKTIDERIWAALQDKRALSDVALEELRA